MTIAAEEHQLLSFFVALLTQPAAISVRIRLGWREGVLLNSEVRSGRSSQHSAQQLCEFSAGYLIVFLRECDVHISCENELIHHTPKHGSIATHPSSVEQNALQLCHFHGNGGSAHRSGGREE